MKPGFNLIDERWIPCVFLNGKREETSLWNTLESAPDIQFISAEYPPMTASILMLLLAVLYRTQKISSDLEWEEKWKQGKFDLQSMTEYMKQWRGWFDLFDEIHPFYQDTRIGAREKDIRNLAGKPPLPKAVNGLILHAASGSGATLFDHSTDEQEVLFTPAQMARLLLMIQGFSLGGMTNASVPADKYYSDAPHARGAVFFLQGNNLFETLMLNLIAQEEWTDTDGTQDVPTWEREDAFADDRKIPDGILDLLTWQSRRILLIPHDENDQIQVKEMMICPGPGVAEDYENPFYSINYREDSKGELKKRIVRFTENRALWRDSAVLLERSSQRQKRVRAMDWAEKLISDQILRIPIRLNGFGQCTEPGKKKAFFYREEKITYPADYLYDEENSALLTRCMDMTNTVQGQLFGAMSVLAERFLASESDLSEGRKPDPSAKDALRKHLFSEQLFWDELEIPFYALINEIPRQKDEAVRNWAETVKRIARDALEDAIQSLGTSPQAMKAGAQASRMLNAGLKKALGETQPNEITRKEVA